MEFKHNAQEILNFVSKVNVYNVQLITIVNYLRLHFVISLEIVSNALLLKIHAKVIQINVDQINAFAKMILKHALLVLLIVKTQNAINV